MEHPSQSEENKSESGLIEIRRFQQKRHRKHAISEDFLTSVSECSPWCCGEYVSVYGTWFTVYSIQFAVYSLQFTVCSLQYTVYSLHLTVLGLCILSDRHISSIGWQLWFAQVTVITTRRVLERVAMARLSRRIASKILKGILTPLPPLLSLPLFRWCNREDDCISSRKWRRCVCIYSLTSRKFNSGGWKAIQQSNSDAHCETRTW